MAHAYGKLSHTPHLHIEHFPGHWQIHRNFLPFQKPTRIKRWKRKKIKGVSSIRMRSSKLKLRALQGHEIWILVDLPKVEKKRVRFDYGGYEDGIWGETSQQVSSNT